MKNVIGTIIFLFVFSASLLAQQTVTGVVKSITENDVLPGASIVLKGTTIGTTADIDGNFSINAPQDGVLVISFMGYKTEEVSINNQSYIIVNLEISAEALDDVVVVGYGTQKKSDITGSVTSVNMSAMKELPASRVDETLQGRVAGVNITNNDAAPNSSITIRVRGVTSINGGNNPLIVIDGVQGGSLSDINPNDIESMEVLKDASATAIYGSKGASGVIIVTTKRGKDTKPVVSYNTYATLSSVNKKMDLMNAYQYANYINENRIANDKPIVFSPEEIESFKTDGGTNWQDEIYRKGFTQNHYLNISGGAENINYSFSGGYLKTDGIIIGSSFKKYMQRSNVSIDITKKLKFNLTSFMSWSEDHPTALNDRDRYGSPVYSALRFSPTKPIYAEDGTYSQPGGGAGPNTEFNPLALATEPIRDNFNKKVTINPNVTYKITDDLELYVNGSYLSTSNQYNFYYNEKVVNGGEIDREAYIGDDLYVNVQNTNMLTYNKKINEKNNLKLTGVYEQQLATFKSNSSGSRGFLTNALTYNNLELGTNPGIPYSYKSEQYIRSFMGRIDYSYDDRYSLTITGRSDASSVFAENNKQAFFPSFGAAWNLSNESFLEDNNSIQELKIRGSYGSIGNSAIRPYQSLATLVTGANFSFNGNDLTSGISLSTMSPNPNLKWETTNTFNIGSDISMYNGRLSFIVDYYNKQTRDLLQEKMLKQASGFQSQLINAGEVLNRGIEFSVSGDIIDKADFRWNSSYTFSKNHNEVIALAGGEKNIRIGGAGLPGFSDAIWLEVGQPIGLVKGLEYAGVWKSDESILAETYGVIPGSPKYVDQNNDGVINDSDIVNIANAQPDFTFGWNNSLTYKNLNLSIFINGQYGNDIYNIARSQMESRDNGTSVKLLDVWTPSNEDTDIPGHNTRGNYSNSSRWVEDGSFIRLQNVTLSYNFSKGLIEKIGIGKARVYVSGVNMFTLTNYSGYDPEANNSGGVDTFAGVDLASYPSQKKFTIGLDIKF